MARKTITRQQTPQGFNYAFGGIGFHSFDGMPGFGGDPLRGVLDDLVEGEVELQENIVEGRHAAHRLGRYGQRVLQTTGYAIGEARRAKSDTLAADARLMEPALSVPPAFAIDHIQGVRAMDAGAQARWIEQADLEGLTAIVGSGNRAALADPLWKIAQERYWVANWTERFNAQTDHPAQPSTSTVLATGPDMAAVRADAEQHRKEHVERVKYIDLMESSAQRLVALLAGVFDISTDEVVDRALGRYREAA